jgi:hypothetical protein
MCLQTIQDLSDVPLMFVPSLGEDQDIVDVNKTQDVQYFLQNMLDKSLETSRRVSQTKWHDQILV